MFKTNGRLSEEVSGIISGFTIGYDGEVSITLDGVKVKLASKQLIDRVYELLDVPIKVEGFRRGNVLYASRIEPI